MSENWILEHAETDIDYCHKEEAIAAVQAALASPIAQEPYPYASPEAWRLHDSLYSLECLYLLIKQMYESVNDAAQDFDSQYDKTGTSNLVLFAGIATGTIIDLVINSLTEQNEEPEPVGTLIDAISSTVLSEDGKKLRHIIKFRPSVERETLFEPIAVDTSIFHYFDHDAEPANDVEKEVRWFSCASCAIDDQIHEALSAFDRLKKPDDTIDFVDFAWVVVTLQQAMEETLMTKHRSKLCRDVRSMLENGDLEGLAKIFGMEAPTETEKRKEVNAK